MYSNVLRRYKPITPPSPARKAPKKTSAGNTAPADGTPQPGVFTIAGRNMPAPSLLTITYRLPAPRIPGGEPARVSYLAADPPVWKARNLFSKFFPLTETTYVPFPRFAYGSATLCMPAGILRESEPPGTEAPESV